MSEKRIIVEATLCGELDDETRARVRAVLSEPTLGAVEATLDVGVGSAVATVELRADDAARARGILERLLGAFGEYVTGAVYVPGIEGPPAPSPFERVEWLTATAEEVYEFDFTREQLLAMPAAAVSERDGLMWIQFYEDPVAPKPGELERARGYLEELLGPPDILPPASRMAGPLPAVGDIQNGIELQEEVAGAMFNSIHRGMSTVTVMSTRERLLTSASGIASGLDEYLRRELKYQVEGVAECITAECFQGPAGAISVLVEVCPAGRPVATLAPMAQADAVRYLLALAAVAEAAERKWKTLVGIHPLTCYADDAGRFTSVAPRALPFLLAVPPMRGGLCLADAYAPAEVWRAELAFAARSPADVFSLCALGLFLVTGRHPFPAHGDPNRALAAVLAGAEPATPPNPLDAILRPGLHRDRDRRPSMAELRDRLSNG